jgi:GntR family transcriptional regulator
VDVAHQLRRPFRFQLNNSSGVPVYRQLIDQVTAGIATGALTPGTQLPTVRQLALDLAINPNTVIRAYRELEIRGILDTQQGSGTFVSQQKTPSSSPERKQRLQQLVSEFVARAGAAGFTVDELLEQLHELQADIH